MSAFDAFAPTYDANFTYTPLGQMLRQRVWQILSYYFIPGQHILDLACGAGEDAVWLARRGLHVTAVDGSPAMCRQTAAKAQQSGLTERIQVQTVNWQDIAAQTAPLPENSFDGVLSNFGGLNATHDWGAIAYALSRLVCPGAYLILVPMGPFCPWETAWHLLHGHPRVAFRRRQHTPALAQIGSSQIPVWYPSWRTLRRQFSPWFRYRRTISLGLWLPPSYLGHLVQRWPRFFAALNRLEAATARLTAGIGDHYILVLQAPIPTL